MRVVVLALSTLLVLSACNKRKIRSIENNLMNGTWKVTSFKIDGQDKTAQFSGVVFTFNTDGTLTVFGSTSITGTWDVLRENDSNDDDLFDDRHNELILNVPSPFEVISDDWEIDKFSDTKIESKDASDDDDVLILERN
jgi:hypothetical protein